jgi:hypothetical protein
LLIKVKDIDDLIRKKRMLKRLSQIPNQECTFAPSINPHSRKLDKSNCDRVQKLLEQQKFYEKKREQSKLIQDQKKIAECTFKPNLSKSIEMIRMKV